MNDTTICINRSCIIDRVTKFTSLWTSAKSGLFPLLEQDVPEDTLKVRPRPSFLTLVTDRIKRRSLSGRNLGRRTGYSYHQAFLLYLQILWLLKLYDLR